MLARARQIAIRPFTVEEYLRMAEAGVFGEDEHVELIECVVTPMAPIGHRQAWCASRLDGLLSRLLPELVVSVQNPLRLGEQSLPQPDIAVIRPEAARGQHPSAGDVLLAAEVAESALAHDRDVKGPLYAPAGIPEYWLVDLTSDRLESATGPTDQGYSTIHRAGRGQRLASPTIPSLEVEIDRILS